MLAILCSVSAEAKQALIFSGGYKGHTPHAAATYIKSQLEAQGFTVTSVKSMSCLDDAESLKKYDLIIPNWTMGKISESQLKNLSDAVKAGAGLAGIHGGMGDVFRKTPEYQAMVGGWFIKHPYIGEYTVDIQQADHPAMIGVTGAFAYESEKYFMRVSDDITVLADTDYSSVEPGLRMPVVWVKSWGKGRVFYSALGHNVPLEYEQFPAAAQIFIKGCLWAARDSVE
jgi:type 1 glutamine amidotransferase